MLDKVCYYFNMLSLCQKCLLDRILFINRHRRKPCLCCWNLFLWVFYLTLLLVALSDASRFVSIILCYIYFCLRYLKKKEGLVHAMQSNGPQNKFARGRKSLLASTLSWNFIMFVYTDLFNHRRCFIFDLEVWIWSLRSKNPRWAELDFSGWFVVYSTGFYSTNFTVFKCTETKEDICGNIDIEWLQIWNS